MLRRIFQNDIIRLGIVPLRHDFIEMAKNRSRGKTKMHEMDEKYVPYRGYDAPYIFVSYAHKDGNKASEVIEKLQMEQYRVWYDEGIDPGTEWDENIAEHIENCEYFIALLSREYLESSNCKDELNFARELEKPRLLIYLEDIQLPGGMRMRLSRLQAIHKYKYQSMELFFEKLAETQGLEKCHEKQKQKKTITIESTAVVQGTPRIVIPRQNPTITIPRQGYPYQIRSGDTVYLGKALPGFFLAEGENLAWRVLKCEDRKAVLLCENVLLNMPYHAVQHESSDWENCTLRKWLNTDFYEQVFSDSEREYILWKEHPSRNNPKYRTPGGAGTVDYVFLLDVIELNVYGFYGFEQITEIARNNGNISWWLRNPGFSQNFAMNFGWRVHYGGLPVDEPAVGVRPAIVIQTR